MNDKVLAQINDRVITQEDIEMLLNTLPPQNVSKFKTDEGKKHLLDELIAHELFYLDAKDQKLDETEEFKAEVKKAIEKILKSYAISMFMTSIKIDEEDLISFYQKNKDQFFSEEQAKASHILVDSLEEAEKILNELTNGLEFEEGAKKYSKCPSKSSGGDLGYFTKGKMVPEFETACFNMTIGEISKPVKTQFGYHIIKLLDKKDPEQKEYEEVRTDINRFLLGQKQNQLYLEKVKDLKEKYDVKVLI